MDKNFLEKQKSQAAWDRALGTLLSHAHRLAEAHRYHMIRSIWRQGTYTSGEGAARPAISAQSGKKDTRRGSNHLLVERYEPPRQDGKPSKGKAVSWPSHAGGTQLHNHTAMRLANPTQQQLSSVPPIANPKPSMSGSVSASQQLVWFIMTDNIVYIYSEILLIWVLGCHSNQIGDGRWNNYYWSQGDDSLAKKEEKFHEASTQWLWNFEAFVCIFILQLTKTWSASVDN